MTNVYFKIVFALCAISIAACSPKSRPQLAESVKTSVNGERKNANGKTVPVVSVETTFNKSALAGREFLYGADLQYSNSYDAEYDLYLQVLPIGHVPGKFRIVGNELQLVADNQRLYFSDINHPEMILTRMKIVSQSEDTITVQNINSGSVLGRLLEESVSGVADGGLIGNHGELPKDLSVRSFEYDSKGDYLLQQTLVEMPNGTIAEFMESIFPRENLNPGANFESFQMDAESLIGADEGPVARFRMLIGEKLQKVINGTESKIGFAQHFDISPKADGSPGTIDWWVTANIPDEYLDVVRGGVEGWNRYFRSFKGINRDVVRFMGRLPSNIHIGDPRYNVVSWDSRLVAGAAYESQASDPESGVQSHSLIYLPAAWLDIGESYWKSGKYSDNNSKNISKNKRQIAALKLSRVACLKNLRPDLAEVNFAKMSDDEIKVFGKELLKGTLLHEVGHALGLGHNFKGSLSFDRQDPKSNFSNSIMDYNHFEIERAAFESLESDNGPILEYDRQALSTIYNKGLDVADTDAVLPACADDEADNEDGGVDPLCLRYDVEKNPLHSVVNAYERVTKENLGLDRTLAQSLYSTVEVMLSNSELAGLKSESDLTKKSETLSKALIESLRFYFVSGRASINRTARVNAPSLMRFSAELPEGFDEVSMRTIEIEAVLRALTLKDLPAETKRFIAKTQALALEKLKLSPVIANSSESERTRILKLASNQIESDLNKFIEDAVTGLGRVRMAMLETLSRPKEGYYLGSLGKQSVNFDTILALQVAEIIKNKSNKAAERTAAAKSLSSFSGSWKSIDKAIASLKDQLTSERETAKTSQIYLEVDAILKALLAK